MRCHNECVRPSDPSDSSGSILIESAPSSFCMGDVPVLPICTKERQSPAYAMIRPSAGDPWRLRATALDA
jgi:hypothetical protein